MPSCYFSPPGSDHPTDGVSVQLQDANRFDLLTAGIKQSGLTQEPVAGVGDEAFFQLAPKTIYPVIFYFKKNAILVGLTLQRHDMSTAQIKQADKQLGAVLASHIG